MLTQTKEMLEAMHEDGVNEEDIEEIERYIKEVLAKAHSRQRQASGISSPTRKTSSGSRGVPSAASRGIEAAFLAIYTLKCRVVFNACLNPRRFLLAFFSVHAFQAARVEKEKLIKSPGISSERLKAQKKATLVAHTLHRYMTIYGYTLEL